MESWLRITVNYAFNMVANVGCYHELSLQLLIYAFLSGSLYINPPHVWEFWLVETSRLFESTFCWELEWNASFANHGSKTFRNFLSAKETHFVAIAQRCHLMKISILVDPWIIYCWRLCVLWAAILKNKPEER